MFNAFVLTIKGSKNILLTKGKKYQITYSYVNYYGENYVHVFFMVITVRLFM